MSNTKPLKRENSRMKRIFAVGVFCSLSGLAAWAAPQTLTGQISDSMCGKSHAAMGEMGKNQKDCTAGCVKTGAKYVFVSGDKIHDIKNKTLARLRQTPARTFNSPVMSIRTARQSR